ncbi:MULTISPECIES: TonB-dependent receptor [unclassified Duganella]|uniref:TonB-dependent receptor n=1 Tax=unclassified Duganella TaxID=2636909 RepID=UPI000886D08F|nr:MULTISPECIES: TonB-dependent receptor [unclassified Duganella]SDG52637.1 Outer membrane receptor for ferrienterochelin and colicins [Duganella sp. OV458]SDJ75436.1 Outer membrane receptor for ferrienterochelin and colicins [Duganella sp. OV510]
MLKSKLILTSSALAVSAAFAAEQDTAQQAVQQVIVTAQKRAQTTIDVPQSMSVISGETLEKEQANSFADYVKLIPSLQLVQSTPGAGRLVMRGLDTGGVASTVAVYMDETPFGSSSGLVNGAVLAGDFDTFDMARVEVLRGPQGALYGASSLGGLVKFITNTPETDRFLMRARVGAASVDGGGTAYRTNLVVNTPISDTLAFRVSGAYDRQPGYIDSIGTAGSDRVNDINKSRNYGGRASLMYTPNKDLSLRLTAVAQNIQTDAPSTVESDPNTLEMLYGRPTQSQFIPQYRNVNYRVYNATLNWNLGPASLTSSTSYSTQRQGLREDDTTNLSGLVEGAFGVANELYLGQNTNLKKVTQELRLSSNQPGTFDWLAGLYYTDEDGAILQGYTAVTPGTLTPLTGLPLLADLSLKSKYREYAAFANTTIHFSPRYDLDLGARYSHNKQSARQIGDGALAGGAADDSAASSEHVTTYSVAPKIKFDERHAVYLRAAKGFRPGGPNVLPPNPPPGTPTTYNSDTVMSYELGYKSLSADGMLSFDITAFHVNWKDIQLLAVVNGFGVNTNGVGAKANGVEFTATLRPLRNLRLSANGAYNKARLDGDTSPLVGGRSGDRLPFSPKYSLGLAADYRWTVGDTMPAYAGMSVRHVAQQSGSFDNDFRTAYGRQRQVPSYNVVDAHVGIELGSWTLEAYGKNLGNSNAITSTSALTANGFNMYPNGAISTGRIAPRTIGLTLTKEY